MKPVAVIGLGKFGFYIAKSLAKLNMEIIAVDSDMEKVQQISQFTDNAFALNSTSKVALEEVGVYNLETVIVSIGENIEASILTVMALKDLNNKNIIAKAINPTHGEILTKLGVNKVVYPEEIAGKILLKQLVENIKIEEVEVGSVLKVVKVTASDFLVGELISNIEEANPNVRIISVNNDTYWCENFDRKYKIQKNDLVTFLGSAKAIDSLFKCNLK
jgi:trk system potassium uptake protein TrkA